MKQGGDLASLLTRFCHGETDRLRFMEEYLQQKRIPCVRIVTGPHIHLFCPPSQKNNSTRPLKLFTAHYDRYPGSPGANDNSAAVFMLFQLAETLANNRLPPGSAILFTDGEELLGESARLSDQGAYCLGQVLREKAAGPVLFIVLDMMGRGESPVWAFHGSVPHKGNLEKTLIRYSPGEVKAEVPWLFSDDTGFLLSGFPTLRISFLPDAERVLFMEAISGISRQMPLLKIPEFMASCIPESWKTAHTEMDSVDSLTLRSFLTGNRLLEDLVRC